MHTDQLPSPDRETFQRVWRRVMPQDRPDCPITLDDPAAVPEPSVSAMAPVPAAVPPAAEPQLPPVACLGPSSTGQLPTLDRFLLLTAEGWQAYLAMAGRAQQASLPTALAQAKRQQFRRLAAARFLISGTSYELPEVKRPQAAPLPLAIRERYQAEQRGALELLTAAEATADPCLTDLFRALAMEDQTHAGQLREWLERM